MKLICKSCFVSENLKLSTIMFSSVLWSLLQGVWGKNKTLNKFDFIFIVLFNTSVPDRFPIVKEYFFVEFELNFYHYPYSNEISWLGISTWEFTAWYLFIVLYFVSFSPFISRDFLHLLFWNRPRKWVIQENIKYILGKSY